MAQKRVTNDKNVTREQAHLSNVDKMIRVRGRLAKAIKTILVNVSYEMIRGDGPPGKSSVSTSSAGDSAVKNFNSHFAILSPAANAATSSISIVATISCLFSTRRRAMVRSSPRNAYTRPLTRNAISGKLIQWPSARAGAGRSYLCGNLPARREVSVTPCAKITNTDPRRNHSLYMGASRALALSATAMSVTTMWNKNLSTPLRWEGHRKNPRLRSHGPPRDRSAS